jgi:uncharacterized membrane protein YbhN (UPF0104 family)
LQEVPRHSLTQSSSYRRLKSVLLAMLAVGLLWLLGKQTHWQDFSQRVGQISWWPMAAGVVAFYLPWLWRGLRVWLLLGRHPSAGQVVALTSACEFLGWLLPAGVGYLSLPPVLWRYLDIPPTVGTKVLLAIRLFDMVALAGTAAVACAGTARVYPLVRMVTIPGAAIACAGVLILLWPDRVGRVVLSVWKHFGGGTTGKVATFVEAALTMNNAMAFRRLLPALAGLSSLIVASRIAALWLMCEGLRAPLSIGQAAYVWSATSLLDQIPIHPPGGAVGVADAINAGVYMSIGWTRQQAAEVALASRVITTPVVLILGGLAWAVTLKRRIRPASS